MVGPPKRPAKQRAAAATTTTLTRGALADT
jgi:hypothetical protein